MNNQEYKNFWDFLRKTPKNLMSVIILHLFPIAGICVAIWDSEHTSTPVFIGILAFCGLIMAMSWVRVYFYIYKRLKK